MNRLTTVSRIGRAVCELAIRSRSQMPFVVTPSASGAGVNGYTTAQDVARALGYTVIGCSLTLTPGATVADFGKRVSEDLSRATGPTLFLLHAGLYDGGEVHRGIVKGLAHLASESWSINGETHLMVLTGEDPIPLARLIGEELKNHDWAAAIPL
jgi:hypothetical protein